MATSSFEVQEKEVGPLLVAGVRMRGRYSDCGRAFTRIGKQFGRHICGQGMLLLYDAEYREADADFEACLPIRRGEAAEGISVRQLPGGRCVSLLHRGPYDQLGHSYTKLLAYIKERGYEVVVPSREVYLKGPGMLWRGNPQRYLAEIQVFVKGGGAPSR